MKPAQRVRRGLCAALMCGVLLGTASAASAAPIAFDTWYEFSFTSPGVTVEGCFPNDPGGSVCVPSSGTPTTFAPAPDWTFVAPATGATLTIIDAFDSGAQFEVVDFGAIVGMTSIPTLGSDCGDDPVPCLASPDHSFGSFTLAAGAHALHFVPLMSLPFNAGAAYFRLDEGTRDVVPEPASLSLLASGVAALLLRARRHMRGDAVSR